MKKKLFFLSLLMTAMPLILAGMDGLDRGVALFGTIYLLCGLIYVSLSILAIKKEITGNFWITIFGFVILLIVAFDCYFQGKKYLPYAYLAAAILSLTPIIVKRFKKEDEVKL